MSLKVDQQLIIVANAERNNHSANINTSSPNINSISSASPNSAAKALGPQILMSTPTQTAPNKIKYRKKPPKKYRQKQQHKAASIASATKATAKTRKGAKAQEAAMISETAKDKIKAPEEQENSSFQSKRWGLTRVGLALTFIAMGAMYCGAMPTLDSWDAAAHGPFVGPDEYTSCKTRAREIMDAAHDIAQKKNFSIPSDNIISILGIENFCNLPNCEWTKDQMSPEAGLVEDPCPTSSWRMFTPSADYSFTANIWHYDTSFDHQKMSDSISRPARIVVKFPIHVKKDHFLDPLLSMFSTDRWELERIYGTESAPGSLILAEPWRIPSHNSYQERITASSSSLDCGADHNKLLEKGEVEQCVRVGKGGWHLACKTIVLAKSFLSYFNKH